jgi:flagellar protein FliS
MNPNEIATMYRETSARGSHPMALVVQLYDAILEDLRRAMNAAGSGDIEGRTASLNHALLVIAELQSVLDHARGGESAKRLDGFYNVTRGLIVEANLRSKPEHMQRLIELFLPVRQAWKKAAEEMSQGRAEASIPSANPSRSGYANAAADISDLDREQAQWNA